MMAEGAMLQDVGAESDPSLVREDFYSSTVIKFKSPVCAFVTITL